MKTSMYLAAALVSLALSMPAFAQTPVTVGANCSIRWNSNVETDLLSYRVYGTLTAPNGVAVSKTLDVPKPAVVAPTVATTCAAIGLQTGGNLSVQVDAEDTLHNRSVRSAIAVAVQDISGPAQPTGLVITPNP